MPETPIIALVLLVFAGAAFGGLFLYVRSQLRQARGAWSELLACRREWVALAEKLGETAEAHGVNGFGAIVRAIRRTSIEAATPGQVAAADAALSDAIKDIVRNAEVAEPMRIDVRWRELQSRLVGSREALAAAAQSYNSAAEAYNQLITSRSALLLSRWSDMREAELYKA